MRRTGVVVQLARQVQTLSAVVARVQTESVAVNAVALQGSGGGGGGGTSLSQQTIQTLSEQIVVNTVSANLSTPTVIANYTIPSAMKGKTGFLTGYFYLKNQTPWSSNLALNYGFAIDGASIGNVNSRLPYYRHSSATDTFAVTGSGSAIVGSGGFVHPLTIPVNVPSGASNFNAVVANTNIPFVTTQVGVVATTTFTFTGSVRTFTVPSNVTSVQVHLWGAGGLTRWGGNPEGSTPGSGSPTTQGSGSGGYTTGYLNVSPGQVLYIIIGGFNNTLVTGGGGTGNTYNATDGKGPRGGGFTGIFSVNPTGQTASQAVSNVLCIAGGGGGAPLDLGTRWSGAGGGLTGGDASGTGGRGATQSAGGTSSGQAGSLLTGGNGSGGGGGGGGYYGGGAGEANNGGGGGSGFAGSLIQGSTTRGNSPPDTSTWASPPQYSLMQSLFGGSAYYGGSYQFGAAAITTQGTYPTFVGSEISVTY